MRSNTLKNLIVSAVAISTMAACSKDDDNNNPGNPPAGPKAIVQVATDATLGKVLTDSTGRTLYYFSNDADGKNNCAGGCAAAWPYFNGGANLTFGDTSLHKEDFGSITVTQDGKTFQQTTYKGWPLYYFAQDAKAGDVKGEKVGNIWYVAKPDYTVMLAHKQLVGGDGKNYDNTGALKDSVTFFLTDDRGRTLYSFIVKDKFNKNGYTLPDFSNNPTWPLYEIAANNIKSVPSILNKADFASIDVFGHPQLTYKGWPLYYFGPDALTRGNTKGISAGPFPGSWPVVNQATTPAPQP